MSYGLFIAGMFGFSVSELAVLVIAIFVSLMGTFAVGSEGVVRVWGSVVDLVLRFDEIVVK